MSRPARAVPWGLVGMLALVALGERASRRVENVVLLPEHWEWRNAETAARQEVAGAEVLCFGDSLIKFAVLPRVVEARTGRAAYNLAVPGGQPAASYFLFRRALAAGARPSAVLIEAAPHVNYFPPSVPAMERLWSEVLTTAELFDLARALRDPGLFGRLAAARALPTVRARHEIRAAVRQALDGTVGAQQWMVALFLRNRRVNRGANAAAVRPEPGARDDESQRNLLTRFSCDPVNANYLDRFLDLAAARGIPAVVVLTPYAPAAQRYAEWSGFDAAHTAFVAALCRRHRGVVVLDGRRSGIPRDGFAGDPLHLNKRGAVAFSDDVAAALGRLPAARGAPAWVTLPPYRAGVERIDVEDFDESALALSRAAGVRR